MGMSDESIQITLMGFWSRSDSILHFLSSSKMYEGYICMHACMHVCMYVCDMASHSIHNLGYDTLLKIIVCFLEQRAEQSSRGITWGTREKLEGGAQQV
mgnify:CR=1 FL=1